MKTVAKETESLDEKIAYCCIKECQCLHLFEVKVCLDLVPIKFDSSLFPFHFVLNLMR